MIDPQVLDRLTKRSKGIDLSFGNPALQAIGATARNMPVWGSNQRNSEDDLSTKLALLNYKDQLSENPLKDELMKSQINANNAMATGDAPQGFVRAGGKIVSDPTFVSQQDSQKIEDKKTSDYEKRLGQLNKDIDPSRYRAGAFGDSKKVFDRGERLQTLGEQAQNLQKGGADKRQMEEFAIGLNAMLSGSNQGAQQQVQALVPHTWWGGAQGIGEYLTNNPTGLGQQKFVQRMLDTISREQEVAKQQMDRTRYARLTQYKDILEGHKQDFEDQMRGFRPPISATGAETFKAAKGGQTPNIPGGNQSPYKPGDTKQFPDGATRTRQVDGTWQ